MYQMYVQSPSGLTSAMSYRGIYVEYPAAQTSNTFVHVPLQLQAKNCGGVNPIGGTNLPTATAALVGAIVMLDNCATHTQAVNGLYVCMETAAGVYNWRHIATDAVV
jgi:hypothetical protein